MVKKFAIQISILLLVAFGALYISFNMGFLGSIVPSVNQGPQSEIKVGETLIKTEIADTAGKRAQGLSGRENMPAESGMLFVFLEARKHQFWTKGMKFPLDMIFIKDGKVVDLIKNIPPPVVNQKDEDLKIYEPLTPIDMMLEVNAGFSEANDIQINQQVFLVK